MFQYFVWMFLHFETKKFRIPLYLLKPPVIMKDCPKAFIKSKVLGAHAPLDNKSKKTS